jgi:hypothetical protein
MVLTVLVLREERQNGKFCTPRRLLNDVTDHRAPQLVVPGTAGAINFRELGGEREQRFYIGGER